MRLYLCITLLAVAFISSCRTESTKFYEEVRNPDEIILVGEIDGTIESSFILLMIANQEIRESE